MQSDSSSMEAVEEATKIYLSIHDGFDYHKRIPLLPLQVATSWHPDLSEYEWWVLQEKAMVGGLSPAHWYEVFLAFGDAQSLERLATFYRPPADATELLTYAPTDGRILEYFANSPDKLLIMTPRDFERLVAELLEKLGYQDVRLAPAGRDGGVDITAYIRHAIAIERVIVQCKRYTLEHKVGTPVVKQLMTEVELRQAARGLIVTTSALTAPARLLVTTYRHRLSHIEGPDLQSRLVQFRRPSPNPPMQPTGSAGG